VAQDEDFRTAQTFGRLRYLSGPTLCRFLQALDIEVEEDDIEIALWPTLPLSPPSLSEVLHHDICEPDAVVMGQSVALAMEAKYVGSRIGHYLTQLGREWLIADAMGQRLGWLGPRLLVVTSDVQRPPVPALRTDSAELYAEPGIFVSMEEQVAQFNGWAGRKLGRDLPGLADVQGTVRWANWNGLLAIAKRLLRDTSMGSSDKRVLLDLVATLDAMGVRRFRGWRFRLPDLPVSPTPTFGPRAPRAPLWSRALPSLPEPARNTWLQRGTRRPWPQFPQLSSLPATPQQFLDAQDA
jgi:hypothetical protein